MTDFWLPVRVYLEDTDAQGVVYNASYFRFMERARTDWLRERGIDHTDFDHRLRVSFVLTSIEARFLAPGRLGDRLLVSADVSELTGARAIFTQQVHRDDEGGDLLAEGRAEVACVDKATGRPRRWPAEFIERLKE
jgi:tol-pal system-associated acyl-CoA thioesterase